MKQVTISHYIQRNIMKALLAAPTASYSMLKPAGIESNLFLYHLQQLIRAGLVEKHDRTYKLSVLGKQHLDRSNLDTMVVGVQPKLVVMLVVQDPDGKYLFLERLHQPFIGMKGFPSGKLHFGETLLAGAYRELAAKAGLTVDDVELALRGNVIMRFFAADKEVPQEIVNHVIGYVFAGTMAAPATQTEKQASALFRSFWADEDLLRTIPTDKAIKGHDEIAQLLKHGEYFVENFDFQSSY